MYRKDLLFPDSEEKWEYSTLPSHFKMLTETCITL